MKVKICGITNIEDALLCESYGADALGFIFYKGSKRYIDPVKAKEIIKHLSPLSMKIGVFVNEDLNTINKIASDINLNAVQLHGEESPAYVEQITHPVIKSFRVNDGFDYTTINQYNGVSVLLDTFSDKEYGGTGNIFNWGYIPEGLRGRIILAGGVSVDNISEIISSVKPAAVDVSSSLEEMPGRKNEQKVKKFFQIINLNRS